ncbi:MAG: VOC family protein [Pseudomonadota bacterium]
MELAKPCIDVGLYSHQFDEMDAFYRQDIGLAYEEFLKIGGGVRQHRYGLNGSVLKLNHSRNPLPQATAVYTGLRRVNSTLTDPVAYTDPEGIPVECVPVGYEDITGIEVTVACVDLKASGNFWEKAMEAERVGEHRYRLADSLIQLTPSPHGHKQTEMRAAGFRYLTVQIWDVVKEYERMIALGVEPQSAPVKLGETAKIAFIRDPDGGFIELSQRANLTGALPDN